MNKTQSQANHSTSGRCYANITLSFLISYPCAKSEEQFHTKKNMKLSIFKIKKGRIQSPTLIFLHENFKTSVTVTFISMFPRENFKIALKVSEYFLIALVAIFLAIVLCLCASWGPASSFFLEQPFLACPDLAGVLVSQPPEAG